ncbi:MAG: hypothetical protein ACLPYS_08745 [Vulcanimicrobiaceae bacterium]
MRAFRVQRSLRSQTSQLAALALLAATFAAPSRVPGAQSPAKPPSAAAQPSQGGSPLEPPQLPQCLQADAELQTKLDTSVNSAGDSFAFAILDRIPPVGTLPEIPSGSKGYGVVLYVQHAHGAGVPGTIILDPRFIHLEDGTRIPVMADPAVEKSLLGQGSTGNAPGVLEYVPFIGIAFSGYNVLHHGKEFVAPKGSRFKVIVGDDLATASCYVVPAEDDSK